MSLFRISKELVEHELKTFVGSILPLFIEGTEHSLEVRILVCHELLKGDFKHFPAVLLAICLN